MNGKKRTGIRPKVLFEAHGPVNAGPSAGPLTAGVLAAGPWSHASLASPRPHTTGNRASDTPKHLLPGDEGEAREGSAATSPQANDRRPDREPESGPWVHREPEQIPLAQEKTHKTDRPPLGCRAGQEGTRAPEHGGRGHCT